MRTKAFLLALAVLVAGAASQVNQDDKYWEDLLNDENDNNNDNNNDNDKDNYICVPSRECDPSTGMVITTGEGIIITKNGESCELGAVPSNCRSDETCCYLNPNEVLTPPTPVSPTTVAPTTAAPTTPTTVAPTTGAPTTGAPTPQPPKQNVLNQYRCGRSQLRPRSDDFDDDGPDMATIGQFPWTVIIYQKPNARHRNELFMGTGSLIHHRAVLSTAHNFHMRSSRKNLFIRAGVHNRTNPNEPFEHQERAVDKLIPHPEYQNMVQYDVVLLILKEDIRIIPTIGFACLPPVDLVPAPGTLCFASGWGANKMDGKYQTAKKVVELPIVDRATCKQTLVEKVGLNPAFNIHESMICAGGEPGIDTCVGDGGAPVVCSFPTQDFLYYQAAMVSWGVGCGEEQPAVYTSVAAVRRWVDAKMVEQHLSVDTYTAPPEVTAP